MAISPDPTVPDVIYLDEQAVDDIFAHLGRGTITEIVERVSSETETTAEAGLSKILVARLKGRSLEGEETEFVRTLDPIGKLAMLREALEEDDLLVDIQGEATEEVRKALNRGNIVKLDTGLLRTPIEEIEQRIEKYLDITDTLDEYIEVSEEDIDEVEEAQEMISALNREGEILRTRTDSSSDFDFILSYNEGSFRNRGLGFPRSGANYTLLGQVTMKFDNTESISLINFVDMASQVVDNPRKVKQKMAEIRREFASSASQLTGRDVSTTEFEISHPDVEMKPLAIYR
jgi:hypothetical protein